MKKKIFLLSVASTLFCSISFAKIWRVNNGGAAADFTLINDAIAAASAGDTIQVEGSINPYNFTCAIKLTFIGPGYLLTKNPETQFNPNSAMVYGTFQPGSDGSVLMGFQLYSTINVRANSISIKRNYGYAVSIQLGDNLSNTYNNDTIEQNYGVIVGYTGNSTFTNLQINNNILYDVQLPATNVGGVFYNNIVYTSLTLSNFLCENNIISADTTTISTTNVFKNNILYNGSSNTTPNGNGNFYVSTFTTIFVDWTDLFGSASSNAKTTDGDAILKAGSPAIGKGIGGVDMGVFSGVFSYVLSGMPPVPSIYNLSVPNTINSSPMPVTISIKSHS